MPSIEAVAVVACVDATVVAAAAVVVDAVADRVASGACLLYCTRALRDIDFVYGVGDVAMVVANTVFVMECSVYCKDVWKMKDVMHLSRVCVVCCMYHMDNVHLIKKD